MKDIIDNIIEQFKAYKRDIIYIIVIFLLFTALSCAIEKCSSVDSEYKNNITALTDTIKYIKAKNGDLVATKTAFESDVRLLKDMNKELYDVIENLKLKNSVTQVIHVDGTIENEVHDTTYIVKHDTINNGFMKEFNFNNKYRILEGLVLYDRDTLGVKILKDIVDFDYSVAMDKNNKIYVTSTNPYIKYNEISGFTVPKAKSYRFSIGPSISAGYDPFAKRWGVIVGASATYNLIKIK